MKPFELGKTKRSTKNSQNRALVAPYEKPRRSRSTTPHDQQQVSSSSEENRPRAQSTRSVEQITDVINELEASTEQQNESDQAIYEYSAHNLKLPPPSSSEEETEEEINMAQAEELLRRLETLENRLQEQRDQQQQAIDDAVERERQAREDALNEQQRRHQEEIGRLRVQHPPPPVAANIQPANNHIELRYNTLTLPDDIDEVQPALEMWELGLPDQVSQSAEAKKKMLIQAMSTWKLMPIFKSKIADLQSKNYDQIKDLIKTKLKLSRVEILFSPRKNTTLIELYNAAKNVIHSEDREKIHQYIERHLTGEESLELRKTNSDDGFAIMIRLLSEERIRKRFLQPASANSNHNNLEAELNKLKDQVSRMSMNNVTSNHNEQPIR